jgi:hypothetical protein
LAYPFIGTLRPIFYSCILSPIIFANSIDAQELKHLLRKHNNAFTDEEIFQIGEEFYAGKSGGSVPFDRFVEAIDERRARSRAKSMAHTTLTT